MSKTIHIHGPMEIAPMRRHNPEDPDNPIEGKQIVIIDMDSGEEFVYSMTDAFAKKQGAKLRMNNKALAAQIQQDMQQAQARATLAGPDGLPPEVAQDLTKGVHVRENGGT